MRTYPATIELRPRGPVRGNVRVPGSKSLTNRALAIAALAHGPVTVADPLVAEDAEVMVQGLRQLGVRVDADPERAELVVHGEGGRIPAPKADLDLRLSGTSIRFLTALACLGRGTYRLDGNARMRERPIEDLLDALRALGANVRSERGTGCPPVIVEGTGSLGGEAAVAGARSSQYLSALLMVAPAAGSEVTLRVSGELQSKPFVDMTIAVMDAFGARVQRDGYRSFRVAPGRYRAMRYAVEGDAMAAGYFWAAAAATGGRVHVENVGATSLQGDRRLADVLGAMGCDVAWTDRACEVRAPAGRLRGGTFDLNDMPDQAQTLAVLGLLTSSPVRIENVWNMRIKETDRLAAMATELRKFGARVDEERDALTVHPPAAFPESVHVDTYGDHRMAMAFAIAGLSATRVVVHDPACVAKTYPGFFDDLRSVVGERV